MLKLSTDHAFHIGHQHLRSGMPCQDYAVSGLAPDGAFAVVSDGCSGGGRTEVGAKVVALAAAHYLQQSAAVQKETLFPNVYHSMAVVRGALGLSQSDMLATAVVARASASGLAYVDILGDGAAAFVYRDGSMTLVRVNWRDNTPAYLAYRDDWFESFINAHGGVLSIGCDIEHVEVDLTGEVVSSRHDFVPVGRAIRGETLLCRAREPLLLAAVFSDGVTQVERVPWTVAIRDLLLFRSQAGAFAKRRMHGFLQTASEWGRGPLDDIAYAVIRLEREG